MKQTELNGYVVRNGTGKLIFYTKKPYRKRETLLTDEELSQECLKNGQKKARVWYPRQWESNGKEISCLLYTSPSPRDPKTSRMPSSA